MVYAGEDVNKFFIVAAIFTVMYLILYYFKGKNKSLDGYAKAFCSCFVYTVCAIFLIVSIDIVKMVSQDNNISGAIIIPIVWIFIVVTVTIRTISSDFGINFKVLKPKLTKKFKSNMVKVLKVLLAIIITINICLIIYGIIN